MKMVSLDTTAIIQARMGSSRLPGKVLMNIEDKPILERIVYSLSRIIDLQDIYIATTTLKEDDPIEEFARNRGVNFYRGEVENVFSRFANIARIDNVKNNIARFTGDNPFIDIEFVEFCFKKSMDYSRLGSNFIYSSRFTNVPTGLGIEIFSKNLLSMDCSILNKYDLEHVTSWMYLDAKINSIKFDDSEFRFSEKPSLTVDTAEDFQRAVSYAKWLGDKPVTLNSVVYWWQNLAK